MKKDWFKKLFRLSALLAGLGLLSAGNVSAQAFKRLHSFTALSPPNNSDGSFPQAGLVVSGGFLYGTASQGGTSGNGNCFRLNPDGSGFTNLHAFTNVPDGRTPECALILSGNFLYGTTHNGGGNGFGIIFRFDTNGANFTNLHSFTGGTGAYEPSAGLALAGSTLYGTASAGGASSRGTVFAVNPDGTGFSNLYNFTAQLGATGTNGDGAVPMAGLAVAGNTIYGTARNGGTAAKGTLFAVDLSGTGFTNLHNFTGGSDGASPVATVILSGDTIYGTAGFGGSFSNGTVFAVKTNGSGFTVLHQFTATNASGFNGDGAMPEAGVMLSGNTLYGAAFAGGTLGKGTVFAVNTDGTGFTNLYNFTGGTNGANPFCTLVLSGSTLYGTTEKGGSAGNGTIFSLTLPPLLTLLPSGTNILLTWPVDAAGFNLQSTANLFPPTWTNASPPPVPINGLNTVTNPIAGSRMFYRLSQ